jgi:hypothetical protein
MGIRNQNSTDYVHPDEPNLLNLHKAMDYLPDGSPAVRVLSNIQGDITITGDVTIPGTVTVSSTPEDPVHTHITEIGTSGILDVPYMPIGGTVDANVTFPDIYKISKDTNANSDSNRIFVNASGTVELGTTTLAALENITVSGSVSVSNFPATQAVTGTFWQATQPVSGTVTIQDGGGSITVDGTVNANVTFPTTQQVSGTVALDANTLSALENIGVTGTVTVQDGGGSITVDGSVSATVSGTVELGATTLSALENTTVTISGTPTVNIGTIPEVEIKNDTGNPVPISANTASNSSGNPVYVSANISNTGPITVAQSDTAVTAFDEPIAVGVTPVIQADAQYGLDPDFWIQSKLNGGNIVIDEYNTWQVSSGTSPGGYARLATAKYMSYQSGQGSLFRWTAAFTASGTTKAALGVDAIVQNTGPIDREDGYSFGYSGSTANDASRKIGILHRRNGKTEIRKLTITRAPTGNQTATVTVDGVAYTVAITAGDVNHCANELATGLKAITVLANTWDIEGCNGIITFTYYSPGAKGGTYSFSSSGAGTLALGTFAQIQAGTTPSDTWTYVDDWDNQTIQFDPTKLNVYQIDMRWLGAGRVRFFMEDPSTGKMVLVHTQRWTSQQVYPHINKPSLRIVYRSGTTNPAVTPSQNVIVRGSSIVCAVQGVRTQTGSSQGRYNISATTRAKDLVWHLMSIQNPYVRNGGVNKASLMMQTLTVAAQGNDPSAIYIVKDAFGASNVLSYIAIPNTTSAMFAQYSISEVTIDLSTQRIANVQTLGINDNATFDLAAYNLTLSPGETISVFISSSNSLTRTAVGLTWLVD